MKGIFEIDDRSYNLRHDFLVKRHNVLSVRYGTETASILAPNCGALLLRIVKMRQA